MPSGLNPIPPALRVDFYYRLVVFGLTNRLELRYAHLLKERTGVFGTWIYSPLVIRATPPCYYFSKTLRAPGRPPKVPH